MSETYHRNAILRSCLGIDKYAVFIHSLHALCQAKPLHFLPRQQLPYHTSLSSTICIKPGHQPHSHPIQTHRGSQVHKPRKQLRPQIPTAAPTCNFKRNPFTKRRRQHQRQPRDIQRTRQLRKWYALRSDRRDRCPEGTGNRSTNERKEYEDAIIVGKDPNDESEQSAREGSRHGHVDPADAIGEVADGRTTEALA